MLFRLALTLQCCSGWPGNPPVSSWVLGFQTQPKTRADAPSSGARCSHLPFFSLTIPQNIPLHIENHPACCIRSTSGVKTDTVRKQSCSPPPWMSLAFLEAGNESRVVPNNRYKHWELGIGTHNMQGLRGALNYCLGFKRCLGRHTPFSPQGYFTLMYGFPLQIGLIHLSRGFFFLLPFLSFLRYGDWTHGLVHARQALYHWTPPALSFPVYFESLLLSLAQTGFEHEVPCLSLPGRWNYRPSPLSHKGG